MTEKKTYDTDAHKVRRMHLLLPAILQGLAWPFGRLALNFFTNLQIEGKENLKEAILESKKRKRGVIFAVNHTHELDPFLSIVSIPPTSPLFPMFYVSHDRKVYGNYKVFGIRRFIYGFPAFFTSCGAHPFISGQRDYTKSMPYHENLLNIGKSVCIFPEGKIKRNIDNNIYKIHGGVSYLAESTNSIIIPIHISGSNNMSTKDFFLRKNTVTVSYKAPIHINDIIDTTEPIPERYKNAAIKIMNNLYNQKI